MGKNARDCLQEAFKDHTKDHPRLGSDPQIRGMMSLALQTLCNPSDGARQCESWDDVTALFKQLVAGATPDKFETMQAELQMFFRAVAQRAQDTNQVFIAPPPYE